MEAGTPRKKVDVKRFLSSYGTMVAGIAIVIIFSILSPTSFASFNNFINITRQISFLVIIGIGATLVMAVKEFDLSIGSVASFGGVISAMLAAAGYPVFLSFIIPVALGFLVGYLNGFIVTKFRVLSFVTTLAMGTIFSGITFWLTGGATVFENIPDSFKIIGQTKIGVLPTLSVIMFLIVLCFWFVMSQTALGRRIYAIGGNEKASEVSGIHISLYKNTAFALCGMLAALTGALLASRLGSAHPTGGDGFFLNAYAAVFLGMTFIKNGVPNVLGTLFGAAIIGIMANGLTILEVPTFIQNIITGAIIIFALIVQKIGSEAK